uniref:Rieske domain-containing protein n=2 Tax=Haptolina ericina TaxID=156174 RepID=A0A7S3B1H0_9EUKA|mmetsp:Transcript_46462/g.104741  ORF Transcript_46462/g.104741 Transcript_46462/m.104741 type:complete len:333 (+) Transcript_46462:451-1449(+)
MGDVEDGVLRCFYHGWAFGAEGKCVDVPTMTSSNDKKSLSSPSFCGTKFAVVEHEGMVYVWRGNLLAADVRKLPSGRPTSGASFVCDTILDYGADWTDVVREKLVSSHLARLHQGLSPDLDQFGVESGNIVRHSNAMGFAEEFHVVPVAPERTRVMLRQRFPKGAVLSTLLQLPGSEPMLTFLVRNRNYQLAVEDLMSESTGCRPQAEASDDLVTRFREWARTAQQGEGTQAFFSGWDQGRSQSKFGPQTDDSSAANKGTWGLKRSYVQDQPPADYAPMNYAPYKEFHDNQNKALQDTAVTGAVSVPAALLTYKTVVPAMASLAATLDSSLW